MSGPQELGELLSDPTLRTVLLGTTAIGAVSGALGVFAYLRKQSLVGDVVAHSSLLGIVVAFFTSYLVACTPSRSVLLIVPGAMAAGIGALLLSRLITDRTKLGEDCGLGVMLALFFGTSIGLLRFIQRIDPPVPGTGGLENYLFGMAAAITRADLWMIGVLGGLALLLLLAFWKEFKVFTFDPGFAHSLGLRVRALDTLLLILMVVGIVIGIHAVGVVLMISLIVVPASAARQWSRSLWGMVMIATLIGGFSGAAGSMLSATVRHLPTGPVIVLVATLLFLVSLVVAPRRGVVARWRQRRRRVRASELVA